MSHSAIPDRAGSPLLQAIDAALVSDPTIPASAPTADALITLRQALEAARIMELALARGFNAHAAIASLNIQRAVLAVNSNCRVTRYGGRWFAHIGAHLIFDGRDSQSRIESDAPEECWLRLGHWLLK